MHRPKTSPCRTNAVTLIQEEGDKLLRLMVSFFKKGAQGQLSNHQFLGQKNKDNYQSK